MYLKALKIIINFALIGLIHSGSSIITPQAKKIDPIIKIDQVTVDAKENLQQEKKKEELSVENKNQLPENAPIYQENPLIPYHKKPSVVEHVLGRKEEAFRLAEEKIDTLPKEDRQQFAELLEIISRYCILDLSKSELPNWAKRMIFMSFAKKYLSNFATNGSHEGPMEGLFPGKKRFSSGWGVKKFVGYMQEDIWNNYTHALIDFAQTEILKMLTKKETESVKRPNTKQMIEAGGDDYYIMESDIIKLILNSKQRFPVISNYMLDIYANYYSSSMRQFIALVAKFNEKLTPKEEKQQSSKFFIEKLINFKRTRKNFEGTGKSADVLLAQQFRKELFEPKKSKIGEQKRHFEKHSIFSRAANYLKSPALDASSKIYQKMRVDLINKLKAYEQAKREKNRNSKKNKDKIVEEQSIKEAMYKENKSKTDESDEKLTAFEEIEVAELKNQEMSTTTGNKKSNFLKDMITKITKPGKPIAKISFILSFIYFFKKIIFQFIKTIIKYSI